MQRGRHDKKEQDEKQRIENERREKTNEFERCFLGSLLSYTLNEIPQLKIQAKHFYSNNHRLIFQSYCKLLENGIKPDILIMTKDTALREIGPSYIASLTDIIPSAANIENYEKEIIKAWQARTAKAATLMDYTPAGKQS